MNCKKCGNEIKEGNIFCTNCGKSINETIKPKKNLIIYATIFIMILITIICIVIIKNIDNSSNNYKFEEVDNNNQQVENEEINIELYDLNNTKPSEVILDDTTETGARYNFTKDDFKLAVENVCNRNNIKYKESSNENNYGINLNLNDSPIDEIFLNLQNNKVIGIGINWSLSEESSTSNLESKVLTEIMKELFEENYLDQILKTKEELSYGQFRYFNNTCFMKMDVSSMMLWVITKNGQDIDEHIKEWELIKEQLNLDSTILMIMPCTQEEYKEVEKDFEEMEEDIVFIENKAGTIFKDNNSISYIKFTSETEFEMMTGQEGSEANTKTGTYSKNGNIVTLNVTYDSELEPSDYNGITDSFNPYEIQMNIIDTNTLKYTDNNITYRFKRNMTSHNDETVENVEESTKVDTNVNNNASSIPKKEEVKKKYTYTHIALMGCVIQESNSETGEISYKHKCESCGALQAGGTTRYLKGGIFNGGFLCYKCNTVQKVQIETTFKYE